MSDALADDVASAPEFRGEFELDLVRRFRRRFGWMCGVYAIVSMLTVVLSVAAVLLAPLADAIRPALEEEVPSASSGIVPAPPGDRLSPRPAEFERGTRSFRLGPLQIGAAPPWTSTPLDPAEELAVIEDELAPEASRRPLAEDWLAGVVIDGISAAASFLVILWCFVRVRPRIEHRAVALSAATRLILVLGLLSLLGEVAKSIVSLDLELAPLLSVALWHFSACLFLPWTARESLRPMIPLLVAWAVFRIVSGGAEGLVVVETGVAPGLGSSLGYAALEILASPLVLVPGMLVCWIRQWWLRRRFGREFAGRQLRSLRQEIKQARRIHDSLFPQPFDADGVRFDYAFVPARDLGGDFLHLLRREDGAIFLTFLDVTGHGLSAAMTVNRLHGEIERLHAERPDISPGEMLAGLNRYVHLTLMRHSILATGVAVLLDPATGRATLSNAGHPPVLLRAADGRIRQCEANDPLLGAQPAAEFHGGEHRLDLASGEVILLYTDGAFEARDQRGRELGLDGFAKLCRHHPAPARWPEFLLSMVEGFEGPIRGDDVLLASLQWTRTRPKVDDGRSRGARRPLQESTA